MASFLAPWRENIISYRAFFKSGFEGRTGGPQVPRPPLKLLSQPPLSVWEKDCKWPSAPGPLSQKTFARASYHFPIQMKQIVGADPCVGPIQGRTQGSPLPRLSFFNAKTVSPKDAKAHICVHLRLKNLSFSAAEIKAGVGTGTVGRLVPSRSPGSSRLLCCRSAASPTRPGLPADTSPTGAPRRTRPCPPLPEAG